MISDIPIFREIAPHAVFAPVDGAPEAHVADWVKAIRSLEDPAVRERVIIDGLSDVRRYSWRDSHSSCWRLCAGSRACVVFRV